MRIVLDTNILIRANPLVPPFGLARDLVLTIVRGPHVLILSKAILIEVQRVLNYPNVQARWPLSQADIDQYLAFLEAAGIMVELPGLVPAVVNDPDDDPIVQTAITGKADILCTRDEAFYVEPVRLLCTEHKIRILDDIALMKDSADQLPRSGEGKGPFQGPLNRHPSRKFQTSFIAAGYALQCSLFAPEAFARQIQRDRPAVGHRATDCLQIEPDRVRRRNSSACFGSWPV